MSAHPADDPRVDLARELTLLGLEVGVTDGTKLLGPGLSADPFVAGQTLVRFPGADVAVGLGKGQVAIVAPQGVLAALAGEGIVYPGTLELRTPDDSAVLVYRGHAPHRSEPRPGVVIHGHGWIAVRGPHDGDMIDLPEGIVASPTRTSPKRTPVATGLADKLIAAAAAVAVAPLAATMPEIRSTIDGEHDRLLSAAPEPAPFLTLSAFLAETPNPVPSLLGEGVIPRGGIALLSGEGGVGKSTLAVQLGLSLGAGLPDFLSLPIPGGVRVLYVQREGNRDSFRARLAVAAGNLGAGEMYVSAPPESGRIAGWSGLAAVIESTGAQVVVIDTISRFSLFDENSSKDWKGTVFLPAEAIARQTGCAFLFLHHWGKPSDNREGRHRTRGSSAMVDDCDTAIRLSRGQSPDLRVLEFDKVRCGPEPEPIVLRFDRDRAIFTVASEETEEAVEARSTDRRPDAPLRAAVAAELERNPVVSRRGCAANLRNKKLHFREEEMGKILKELRPSPIFSGRHSETLMIPPSPPSPPPVRGETGDGGCYEETKNTAETGDGRHPHERAAPPAEPPLDFDEGEML